MGNSCEKCCSNADDPSEFFDNPNSVKDPLQDLLFKSAGGSQDTGKKAGVR